MSFMFQGVGMWPLFEGPFSTIFAWVFFSQNHLGFGIKKLVNSFKERINLGLPAFIFFFPAGEENRKLISSSCQKKKSIFYTSVGGVKNRPQFLLPRGSTKKLRFA